MDPHLLAEVRRISDGFALTFEAAPDARVLAARIERACPDVLLIDTDLLGGLRGFCHFARARRPDARIIGVTYYWSERDEGLDACVDAVLHKPPRRAPWERAFERLAVPRAVCESVLEGATL
jgi:DNA-binding response OmpR family regulator